MNATDWLNYFQAQGGKPEERKADWLDSAGTVLGAGIGFLAGGPPGAMAGASLGGAAGGAAENAANGGVTLQDLMRLGMAGGSMAMPFNMGGNYALGGMVNDPMFQQAAFGPPANAQQGPAIRSPQDVAEFMRGMEEAINGMPGSTFTPEQPKHPTLEMLASVVPQVVSALPKPRETKSVNKTIGAWLPAASTAFAGPINYGKAQREDRNKKGSEAAKALADHRWAIAKSMTDNLDAQRAGAQPQEVLSIDEATKMGHPEWAGMRREDVRLKLAGEPKPKDEASPTAKLNSINTLVDNMRQDADIRDFGVVRDNYRRVERMSKMGNGVGDLAVIFSYMKVLDPTSVVRESEYKNAAEAVGQLSRVVNLPKNILQGDKLTPKGREWFLRASWELYQAKRNDYANALQAYENQAAAYGIDSKMVTSRYRRYLDDKFLGPPQPNKPKLGKEVK